jgi:AcrR family transcriptional regulator
MADVESKQAAIDARRAQIMNAASACARRSGFHGASMAEIAQAAGLSVGQIYRYFENKEAIISAIVARDVAQMHAWFAEIQDVEGPLVDTILATCAATVDDYFDRDRAALDLEVVAEAARNPAVAKIVEAADAERRALGADVLRRTAPDAWEARERAARHEVLSMLFEGLTIRGVKHPGADREAIAAVLRMVVRYLLSEPRP